MTTRYLITKEEKCPECQGEGYISNEIYKDLKDFTENLPEWEISNYCYTDEISKKQDNWMADQGYPGGLKKWPPEEWPCPTCEGSKIYKQRVNLIDALKDILTNDPITGIQGWDTEGS